MMSTVLVVQPDEAQADVLREIFARRVGAELVMVDSAMEAVDEIAVRMPDLILLSARLSPRDEDTLIAHLRSLAGASHLQTITIPQFRTAHVKAPEKKGGLFRKKSKTPAPTGCDPMAFAEEVVVHLKDACDIRNRPQAAKPVKSVIASPAPSLMEDESSASASAFDTTPFQSQYVTPEPEPFLSEPLMAEPEMQAPNEPVVEPPAPASIFDEVATVEDVAPADEAPFIDLPRPARIAPRSIEIDEIDQLARELGLNLTYVETPADEVSAAPVDEGDIFDFGAALDRARNDAGTRRPADLVQPGLDAEAIREAAIAEARVIAEKEAREAVAADLARVQAEAEAMREAAIADSRAAEVMREAAVAEAREAAVREARERMDAELTRMRSETEVTVARALNKVKLETEEAERLRAEEARLRAEEADRLRAEEARLRAEEAERVRAEAESARAEAERVRIEAQQAQEAFAAELARVRSEVESTLTAQLDAARAESERMHAAEAAAARERAGVETQLQAELDRLKFVAAQTRRADESESRRATDQIKQLESELARVHAQADERQAAQLEELRVQMADMREAAAQQARAAAAEAVASEVARAAAQSNNASQRKPNIIRMQPKAGAQDSPARQAAAREIEKVAAIVQSEERSAPSGDYYSLFQPTNQPAPAQADEQTESAGAGIDYRRHAKWALPVAACLLLVTNTGTAISTVTRFVTPDEKPALIVQPVNPEPFIEVVEQRVGSLKVESTPDGSDVTVDGRRYGKTPVTIPDLEVGAHTLVLKSAAGTITRRVTIKSNQTTLLSEAIFSGWLAIFSPIPVTVAIDGKPVNLTEDGRVMTTPGKHVVELVSERFNYRATETLDVRPGETTAHTLTLPMGSVRVTAPAGAEIKVDGAPASGAPAEGLSMSIGSHEISATHPSLGERRASVDVRHGAPTDVTLQFEP
jgi:hypothetical protein